MDKTERHLALIPLWIIAIIAVGTVLHDAAGIFLWVIASFFLFALLDPAFVQLKRRKVPKLAAALILVGTAVFLSGMFVFLLAYFSSNIVAELEDTKRILLDYYGSISTGFKSWIDGFTGIASPANSGPIKPIPKVEMVETSPFGGELGLTLMHGLGSALTVVTFAALWPILTFFLIAERDSLAKVVGRAFSRPGQARTIWKKIVESAGAFFLGNLILALVSYPIFLIIMLGFGVKSPFTQSALASFFNIVPFVGSVLAGLLPSLALLSQTENLGLTITLFALCMGVHFVIANFVTPKILGSRVDINAATSTIALLVWGELWGGLGLLLAIPLTSLIKILMENSNSAWPQWFAALMSAKVVDQVLESTEVTSKAK